MRPGRDRNPLEEVVGSKHRGRLPVDRGRPPAVPCVANDHHGRCGRRCRDRHVLGDRLHVGRGSGKPARPADSGGSRFAFHDRARRRIEPALPDGLEGLDAAGNLLPIRDHRHSGFGPHHLVQVVPALRGDHRAGQPGRQADPLNPDQVSDAEQPHVLERRELENRSVVEDRQPVRGADVRPVSRQLDRRVSQRVVQPEHHGPAEEQRRPVLGLLREQITLVEVSGGRDPREVAGLPASVLEVPRDRPGLEVSIHRHLGPSKRLRGEGRVRVTLQAQVHRPAMVRRGPQRPAGQLRREHDRKRPGRPAPSSEQGEHDRHRRGRPQGEDHESRRVRAEQEGEPDEERRRSTHPPGGLTA